MKSYCVKQKKVTECVPGSERYEPTKNGRMMLKCICSDCGKTKTKFVGGSLFDVGNSHSIGEMVFKGLANSGAYLARKGAAKTIKSDYAKSKIKQTANKYLDQALDSFTNDLSKKISGGNIDYSRWFPMEMYSPQGVHDPTNPLYKGGAVDIHKLIGKLPKPKSGWTLPGHKYTGPYNDLNKQVKYNPTTGEILEIYDKPTGKTDAIAMQHDVDYSVCKGDKKCKNIADRKMVKALDAVPWNERQWGHWLARNVINTKQKLGLGVRQKNVKSRRVK